MNKRYIDFVPVDKKGAKKAPAVKAGAVKVGATKVAPVKVAPKKPVQKKVEPEELPLEEIFEEKPRPAGVSTGLSEAKFGVIEDYRPKFVRTEVPKRPLAAKRPAAGASAEAKMVEKSVAKPVQTRPAMRPMVRPGAPKRPVAKKAVDVSRPVAKKPVTVKPVAKSVAKKPVGPEGPRITKFLNTNKIEKRPLSRQTPKFVPPTPEPVFRDEEDERPGKKFKKKKSPERIITMPDKDSRAGMIVAVILTIILGAAAGTVAFLLLPK